VLFHINMSTPSSEYQEGSNNIESNPSVLHEQLVHSIDDSMRNCLDSDRPPKVSSEVSEGEPVVPVTVRDAARRLVNATTIFYTQSDRIESEGAAWDLRVEPATVAGAFGENVDRALVTGRALADGNYEFSAVTQSRDAKTLSVKSALYGQNGHSLKVEADDGQYCIWEL
jgi:hypothetical protein